MRIFRKPIQKIQVLLKYVKFNGYCTWRSIQIYDHISWILFGIRNISEKPSRENQNTHFVFGNWFQKIVPFMRLRGKINYSQTGHRWCKISSRWVTKTTDTHSEQVTLIALPLQKRLHECTSMLRYTYIVCLVKHHRVTVKRNPGPLLTRYTPPANLY